MRTRNHKTQTSQKTKALGKRTQSKNGIFYSGS
jgi:hypothetical protein